MAKESKPLLDSKGRPFTLKDKYGEVIVPGVEVAFNLSGGVCFGKVKMIQHYIRYGKHFQEYGAENGAPYVKVFINPRNHLSSVSVVKNIDSIIVVYAGMKSEFTT